MTEIIVGSKMKAENTYGRNGATNASSDLPRQKTTSGFLPACELPTGNSQTRDVSTGQKFAPSPAGHGMKSPNKAGEKVPTK
ncbi:MAG TPA: hypothetical protein VIJ52_00740 [Pseudolabrys sp.]